jgi:hypothetical protein
MSASDPSVTLAALGEPAAEAGFAPNQSTRLSRYDAVY